jgi:hypothetical protein
MKILYGYPWYPAQAYGNVKDMTLRYLSRLRQSGFDVDGFCLTLSPPAQCLSFPELDRMWRRGDRRLLNTYEKLLHALEGCDVFFNAAGINLHPEFVEQLPVVTVFGCNDDPENSENLSRPAAASYDLCMIGNIAEIEMYKSLGVKRVEWLPMGLQPGIWDQTLTKEEILNGTRDIDLFMLVDRMYPVRKARLDQLAAAFPNGSFYGNGWGNGYLPTGSEMEWLKRTKIGPNIHNSTGPINFRTFYLPANGVLQICDNKSHLSQIYKLGEEAIGFDNIIECIELCRYYLHHDEERRRIAANGWARATTDYTEVSIFERLQQQIKPLLTMRKEKSRAQEHLDEKRSATRLTAFSDVAKRCLQQGKQLVHDLLKE